MELRDAADCLCRCASYNRRQCLFHLYLAVNFSQPAVRCSPAVACRRGPMLFNRAWQMPRVLKSPMKR
jgi:hypothetical protein